MRVEPTQTKNKAVDYGVLLVLIGLFLAPIFVREMILSKFYQINYFAVLGCAFILFRGGGKIKKKNLPLYILMFLMLGILIISEMHAGRTVQGFFRVFAGLLIPLTLLSYRPINPEETIKVVINALKAVSIFILVTCVIDFFADKQIILAYYKLAHDDNYYNMAFTSNRMFSYVGHPLYNAEIFLMTFGLNYAYNEIFLKNHKNDKWIILITLFGIVFTASKSAIAIFLGLLVVLYIKNWKYMIFCLSILIFGYFNGLFDLVMERFNGSLTTGRNEVWSRIKNSGIQFFHFFWGNGSDSKYSYSYLEEWARAAFEYPYRLFALEFGILFSGLLLYTIFIIPAYKIIKNKSNRLLLLIIFAAISLHVNIYNGIGTYSDAMYLFCLFVFVILNMSILGRKVENIRDEK